MRPLSQLRRGIARLTSTSSLMNRLSRPGNRAAFLFLGCAVGDPRVRLNSFGCAPRLRSGPTPCNSLILVVSTKPDQGADHGRQHNGAAKNHRGEWCQADVISNVGRSPGKSRVARNKSRAQSKVRADHGIPLVLNRYNAPKASDAAAVIGARNAPTLHSLSAWEAIHR